MIQTLEEQQPSPDCFGQASSLLQSGGFLLDPQPAVGNMQVWRAKY